MLRRRPLARTAVILSVWAAGCARIEYRKVPTPTQYGDHWTIEDQRKADAMEGPRYYLPRPYLLLKEPVPVAMRTAFVSLQFVPARYETVREVVPTEPDVMPGKVPPPVLGEVPAPGRAGVLAAAPETRFRAVPPREVWKKRLSAPAHFAVVLPANPPAWLQKLLPPRVSVSAAREFFTQPSAAARLEDAGVAGPDPKAATETRKETEAAAKSQPPSTVTGRVGFINDEDPVTKLGPAMDVVYLPDMEEQFVVKRHYGLGTGDLQMALRNGWAAETFGETVDNSNLIPYVVDQVEHAAGTALDILTDFGVKKKVSQLAGATPIAGGSTAPAAKSREEAGGLADSSSTDPKGDEPSESDIEALLGKVVWLKVVEVRIAQKGVYPILKPRELRDWFKLTYEKQRQDGPGGCPDCDDACGPLVPPGGDPDQAFQALLRRKNLAWIRPDQVFVPAPPFTMVGFNVVTDAYIGTVTKSELGLGTYAASGELAEGDGGSVEPVAGRAFGLGLSRRLKGKLNALGADHALRLIKLTRTADVRVELKGEETLVRLSTVSGTALPADKVGELLTVLQELIDATVENGESSGGDVRFVVKGALGSLKFKP